MDCKHEKLYAIHQNSYQFLVLLLLLIESIFGSKDSKPGFSSIECRISQKIGSKALQIYTYYYANTSVYVVLIIQLSFIISLQLLYLYFNQIRTESKQNKNYFYPKIVSIKYLKL